MSLVCGDINLVQVNDYNSFAKGHTCSTIDNWNDDKCYNELTSMLYDYNPGSVNGRYNNRYLKTINDITTFALKDHFAKPTVNANTLKSFCKDDALSCDNFLSQYCKNCTHDDVSKSPELIELCGCYSTGSSLVPRSNCDSVCNNILSVKSDYDPVTGLENKCKLSVCVIDGISVNSAKNIHSGNLNIDQICNGCDTGSCMCVIDDINLLNTAGMNINISSDCQSSLCYTTVNGVKESIPCPIKQNLLTDSKVNIYYLLILLGSCLILAFVISI